MKTRRPVITYLTVAVCVIVTVMINTVSFGNTTEAAILYGAFYKPFILAGEWWRLLTMGLCHVSFLHLFVNMLSMWMLGGQLEKTLGRGRFLIILCGSVLGGSLVLLAAETNEVALGLSGGLYGLLACYTVLLVRAGVFKNKDVRADMIRIYAVNLLINFLPGIAWKAHLGGALWGFVLTGIAVKKAGDPALPGHYFLAGVGLALALGYLCLTNAVINEDEMYIGTDLKILRQYRAAGFDDYAVKMAQKLDVIYNTGNMIEFMIGEGV